MAPSRGVVIGGSVAAALVAVALLGSGGSRDGPPLDPRSDGPLGTSALVSLLEDLDARVELSAGLPDARDDVALLLSDRLDEEQADEVWAWVRRGGTLVVTDPASSFVPAGALGGGGDEPGDLAPGICTIGALGDVREVDSGAAVRFGTDGAYGSCFGSRDFAFVVASSQGGGDVVAIGGAAFLTNERLAEADNAVLAASVLAPRARAVVRFVDAPIPAGGGDKTLWELLSDGVRRAGVQLGLAFLLYAAWRALRLGRPVAEEQPVEIAGSELVSATGRLLERGRAPGAAATLLRDGLRRALHTRLGVSPATANRTLAQLLVERSGISRSLAEAAVGDDPVTTDDELVTVARAVASVNQEVLR